MSCPAKTAHDSEIPVNGSANKTAGIAETTHSPENIINSLAHESAGKANSTNISFLTPKILSIFTSMLTSATLRSKVDALWDRFWSGGISNPLTAIEQMSYLIFLKRLEDMDNARAAAARRRKTDFKSV